MTRDGTRIFFKDWGRGQPIVFSHGFPMNADAWDHQLLHFASKGFRAIAHDRRGHGRSSQPWNGNDMDTYADDLSCLIERLELRDAILVGHCAGAGEVVRYCGRFGTKRLSKIALVGGIAPRARGDGMNGEHVLLQAIDEMRASLARDRSQFYADLGGPFYGANRPGSQISRGVRDELWLHGMQVGTRAALACLEAIAEADFTADLKRIGIPMLVVHGDDDQMFPVDRSARVAAQLASHAVLKIYEDAPHALPTTHKDRLARDLMKFAKE